jgi:hypothetical protein
MALIYRDIGKGKQVDLIYGRMRAEGVAMHEEEAKLNVSRPVMEK